MENRDRDKISKNTGSTPAGDVNRNTSSNIGQQKSGSSANFGDKVGRSENIESDRGSSGSRQSGSIGSSGMQGGGGRSSGSSGLGSSSGRSGSSVHSDSSDIGDVDRGDMSGKKSNRGGSSNESL